MGQLTFFSPAKVNLFFKVLFKRPDGYHEIASLFRTIDFGDLLTFELSEKDAFTCEGLAVPLGPDNLVLKALACFRKKLQKPFFVKIHLKKNIPLQAGLGGGSSNAATALFALNELLGAPFDLLQLLALAGQIGSDVPFFFSSGSAYCTGRGEKFEDLFLPPDAFYLAKPPFGLATKMIFENFQLSEALGASFDPGPFLRSWEKGRGRAFNDLERTAVALSPALGLFKKRLEKAGFKQVSMTGSGSVFLCFGHPKKKIPDLPWLFVETLQRNSRSWYPVCLCKEKPASVLI
ncbi:MAG: 4-(cytidine 5'-diphospho)-2-C-methyl-D-erythritol kinase [Parachlamydiales bacterium]|jgi:4-diphosphocytidyl-2-C-methyl-D-erythritol kinase